MPSPQSTSSRLPSKRASLLLQRAQGLELAAAADRELAKLEERDQDVDGWVDQNASPLGKVAHLRAARAGKFLSHRIGKRVLCRRSDLDRYIESAGVRTKMGHAATSRSTAEDIRDELGLEGGAR